MAAIPYVLIFILQWNQATTQIAGKLIGDIQDRMKTYLYKDTVDKYRAKKVVV